MKIRTDLYVRIEQFQGTLTFYSTHVYAVLDLVFWPDAAFRVSATVRWSLFLSFCCCCCCSLWFTKNVCTFAPSLIHLSFSFKVLTHQNIIIHPPLCFENTKVYRLFCNVPIAYFIQFYLHLFSAVKHVLHRKAPIETRRANAQLSISKTYRTSSSRLSYIINRPEHLDCFVQCHIKSNDCKSSSFSMTRKP